MKNVWNGKTHECTCGHIAEIDDLPAGALTEWSDFFGFRNFYWECPKCKKRNQKTFRFGPLNAQDVIEQNKYETFFTVPVTTDDTPDQIANAVSAAINARLFPER